MSTDDELIALYLEPNPNRLGGANWRLKDHGVSVWAIVGYWKTVGEDIQKVAAAYVVPPEAVEAALAYYNQHRELIDDRLATNAL